METIKIRKISKLDIDQLKDIGKRCFSEAFSADNDEANMDEYLEREFSSEKLIIELSDKNSDFYFAEIKTKAIGYLKINFGLSQTEIKDSNAMEIERIYVLREYYGKNVGHLLYQEAIKKAKEKRLNYIWLGVWEKNPRAIRFYKKNDFVEFDKHIFKLGDDEQTDLMMKLQLK